MLGLFLLLSFQNNTLGFHATTCLIAGQKFGILQ